LVRRGNGRTRQGQPGGRELQGHLQRGRQCSHAEHALREHTDYKFNIASKLTYSGGKIDGSWSETTCDAAGSGSGTAAGDMVHAIISSDKFSGRMSINVSDSSHTIIVQFDQIGLLSAGRECFAASLGLKGEDQREHRFTGAPMAG
jgi:hypothetical protein